MMNTTHSIRRAISSAIVIGIFFITPLAGANNPDTIISAYRSKKFTQAMALIDEYIASGQKDPQILLLRGVIMAETGRTKEAKEVFQGLIIDYPQLPEPYNNIAVLYAAEGDFQKARTMLEMAIKTNPSYATAHENLGDIYAKLASDSYAKALNLQSKNNVQPKLRLINQVVALTPTASIAGTTTNALKPTMNAKVVATPPTTTTSNRLETTAIETTAKEKNTSTSLDPATHDAVEKAIENWRRAWSERNIQAYLESYTPDYLPTSKVSREQWVNERTARITRRKWIEVRIEDLTLTAQASGAVHAQFMQHYRSDSMESRTRKELILEQRNGNWLITSERNR